MTNSSIAAPIGRPTRTTLPVWLRGTVAGLAIVASIPPWGWWPMAFVGIAILDRLIADQPPKVRFGRTWLVAAVWLSIGMVWMWDMTPPGYLVAVALYAGYFAVAAALVPPGRGRRLGLPAAFTLAEALRWSFPFGGVPLATLPQGQIGGPLGSVVTIAGPLLLVAVTVVVGQALASATSREHRPAGIAVVVVVVTLVLAAVVPTPRVVGTLDVAVVQGGGPQRTRDSLAGREVVFQAHLDASELIETPVDLVLWPENVIHGGEDFAESERFVALSELARRLDAPLVVGVVESSPPDRFYNASVVIDADGEIVDRYDKVRRVPFGEVTPFRSLLQRIAGDTIQGRDAIPGTGPAIVDTTVGPMSVAISWEVFFAGRVREGVELGGEVVLNPTNGASYWLTIIQSQQVASSRLRARETGRWVLQAAPTGFSAVIDPEGDVRQRTKVSEQAVLHATVERRVGNTWAVSLGDRPPIAAAMVLLVAAWVVARGVRLREGE